MMPFRRNVNPNISTDKSPQILISKPKITKTQEINTERERGRDRDQETENT